MSFFFFGGGGDMKFSMKKLGVLFTRPHQPTSDCSQRQTMHLRNSVSVWCKLRTSVGYVENVTKLLPLSSSWVINMSCTVLPEILGNVPLLRLNNPQLFEGRIFIHLQVEQGKEELNVVGPCLLTLKRWIISKIFVTVLTTYDCHIRWNLK